MNLYPKSNSSKSLVTILLILLVVLLRFSFGGFNWSYFIVLGNDFTSSSISSDALEIQEGPGYDGQFYYGLAQEPFSFEKEKGGVIIDHPPYRHQRILYPFLAYLASFGVSSLVPFMLVLINIFSLFVISHVVSNFNFTSQIKWSFLIPFLISGLWLSLSRDLTECLEVALLILTFKYFIKNKLGLFILFSCLSLLTRETTVIFIGTMALIWFWKDCAHISIKTGFRNAFILIIPFFLLASWKFILLNSYPNSDLISAGSNITFPLNGIYMSFLVNFKGIISTRSFIEFAVWLTFLTWQFSLFIIGIRAMVFQFKTNFIGSTLSVLSLVGICFALLFSISIYIDDWAFLRVLASLDLFLILLIIERKGKLINWFSIATVALACITIARIILRV